MSFSSVERDVTRSSNSVPMVKSPASSSSVAAPAPRARWRSRPTSAASRAKPPMVLSSPRVAAV